MFNDNTINGVQYSTNGSHEYLFIRLDDKWYYSDPLYAIEYVDTVSYLRILLPTSAAPWKSKNI